VPDGRLTGGKRDGRITGIRESYLRPCYAPLSTLQLSRTPLGRGAKRPLGSGQGIDPAGSWPLYFIFVFFLEKDSGYSFFYLDCYYSRFIFKLFYN
jgi:hypothetical protein